MEYLVIPVSDLKEVDEGYFEGKYRISNDGTQAIIHKDMWDRLTHYVAPLPLYPDEEVEYPLPIYSGDDINAMPEFQSEVGNE